MDKPLLIERENDAIVIAQGLASLYPSYRFAVRKPKRARKWRIAVMDNRGGFLRWASV